MAKLGEQNKQKASNQAWVNCKDTYNLNEWSGLRNNGNSENNYET